ncbi:MAG: RNA 2',3'-cyclic phosphodiesterase [Thermoplasmatota archaeon]
MRLFIALDIPKSEIFQRLQNELAELSRSFRTVRPENHHISLKFLGDPGVPSKRVIECIKDAGMNHQRSELQLDEMGAFPSFRKPSVLWLGSSEGNRLRDLSEDLDSRLHKEIGTPRETRNFRAHLTVARVKDKGHLPTEEARDIMQRALQDLGTAGYSIPVDEYHLYNSTLTPEGPIYTRLASFPLAKGE